jgi:hypothetical protein
MPLEVISEILEKTNQAQRKATESIDFTDHTYEVFTNSIQYISTLYEKDDE